MFSLSILKDKKYRATPYDKFIIFFSSTEIKEMSLADFQIPQHKFYFCKYSEVQSRADMNLQLTGGYLLITRFCIHYYS
jgi:hypothetical protein